MIDRLVVHLGHEKTGTSSLQHTFSTNGAALEAAGLVYPRLHPTRPRWEHFDVSEEFGAGGGPFAPGRHWARFCDIVNASGCRTAVFSSEFLLRLSPEKVPDAIAAFGSLARRVDCLIYVRHPVHYANSAVSQAMRYGRPLSRLIERPFTVDIRGLVTRWSDALDASPVDGQTIVRPYRRDIDPAWSLTDDLLRICGADPAAIHLSPQPSNDNPALSSLAVYLLDWINRHIEPERIDRNSLGAFEALRGPAYVLPADAMARARRHTAPALAWLEATHGIALSERALEPSPPCPLSEAELASLAKLTLGVTQFNYEVERSRLGWWLGLRAPGSTRRPGHPIHRRLAALGLVDRILGEGGRRAVSVEKRLGPSSPR